MNWKCQPLLADDLQETRCFSHQSIVNTLSSVLNVTQAVYLFFMGEYTLYACKILSHFNLSNPCLLVGTDLIGPFNLLIYHSQSKALDHPWVDQGAVKRNVHTYFKEGFKDSLF